MLRPVVRELIAHGIAYPAVHRMMKELYVEVAESDFALPFKRMTDSRVSLVTGLNRKEVSQLRKRREQPYRLPEVEGTIVTRVLGRWMAAPPFATPDGSPQRLLYESSDPAAPTFATLVRDLGPDVPVRSVLDELLRLGFAEIDPNGYVRLVVEAYVPPSDAEGKLTLLGSDPAEVFSTIMHNIDNPDAPHLQRKVAYDNIGTKALPVLREKSLRLGEEFIRRANALLAAYDRDRNPNAPGGERCRFVLGTYAFEEEPQEKAAVAGAERALPPGRIRKR
jgi:hypothetical protein